MATTVISPSSSSPDPSSALPSLLLMGSPISLHRPFPPCSLEAIPSFDWSDFPAVGSSSTLDENDSELSYLSSHIYQPQHMAASASEAVHPAFFFAEPCAAAVSPLKERNTSMSSDSSAEFSPIASTKSRKKARRSVGFQSLVQVRTYAVTLGDHPYCPGGLALTCDWAVQHEARVSMESLEHRRPKKASELRLSYVQRRHRLVECTGLSPGELLQLEYEQDFFARRQQADRLPSPTQPSAYSSDADSESAVRQMHIVYHHRSRPLHHAQHSSALLNLLA
jgi:hypothetical protein